MFVIPAYAGIQERNKWIVEDLVPICQDWIPASAGMTRCTRRESDRNFGQHYVVDSDRRVLSSLYSHRTDFLIIFHNTVIKCRRLQDGNVAVSAMSQAGSVCANDVM